MYINFSKMSLSRIRTNLLISGMSEKIKYLSYKSLDNKYHHDSKKNDLKFKYLGIGAGVASIMFYKYIERRRNNVFFSRLDEATEAGLFRRDLPNYTLEEVNEHVTTDSKIWVTYKQGVYDITKFVNEHPGGDKILLAAGSSVEPFWLLYASHKTPQIFNMLEKMRIGNLSKEDARHALINMEDPYANEPMRHNVLKPTSRKPFNAEPPSSLLVENFYTPNEIFYVRNHLPVPDVDPQAYELELEIDGIKEIKTLKLTDIKKLPKYSISATVMCAGNRRNEMSKVKEVKGLSWGASAIGNAEWSGARLVDVLKSMGIDENTKGFNHVHFEGLDTDTTNIPYSTSIPFFKATDKWGDVLLAYEMNGEPLPRDHGYPIRVIVPGTVGARNVKWLGKIIISKEECTSHWQQNDYKGCSPNVEASNVDWSKYTAIQELPVISAICNPSEGDIIKVEDGSIDVKGYAWSGGGKRIVRVDVTIDNGNKWYSAKIDHQQNSEPPHHWCWTLWSLKIPVPEGAKSMEIWAKATDSSYNCQPDNVEHIWNFRGVLNNAFHRVKVYFN